MSMPIKGGSFLFKETEPQDVFTPEDFTTEHKLIAETAAGFVEKRVMPQINELEKKNRELTESLICELGELGLLSADIPEKFGGIDVDKITSYVITEELGKAGSFAIAQGCQVGIGSLPIVFFGNEDQKKKYLPDIASGKRMAAYALTEPAAGSDALAIKTKAKMSDDGKFYILNGSKQFISNAGFSDIFIVFAKIDGEKFSAFIVDGKSEGFSTGEEEKKMGIRGSSTRTLYMDDVKVPVENLLYEAGKGHVVAFNILNIGRLKASANCLGAAKYALELSVKYANERRQFNTPIGHFGMIKEKIAKMAQLIYASESMLYRIIGMINEKLKNVNTDGPDGGQLIAKGIEEYAIECSISKVFITEMLDFVVDEGLQIHGGYGFIEEYPIERLYRDSRIFRIFEGTNEINRTLIPTLMIRKGNKNDLPLNEAVIEIQKKYFSAIKERKNTQDLIEAAKDIFLYLTAGGLKKYNEKILKEQEILGRLADILIWTLAMESAWLRAQKETEIKGKKAAETKLKMADCFAYHTVGKIMITAEEILAATMEDHELDEKKNNLIALMKYKPINCIAHNQEIAYKICTTEKYSV